MFPPFVAVGSAHVPDEARLAAGLEPVPYAQRGTRCLGWWGAGEPADRSLKAIQALTGRQEIFKTVAGNRAGMHSNRQGLCLTAFAGSVPGMPDCSKLLLNGL
jgi:hypothetical protein